MINTNYSNQLQNIGFKRVRQKYPVNYEKFSLGIKQNQAKTEDVKTDSTVTVPDNEVVVSQDIKTELADNKTAEINYQNSLSDLLINIERLETEKRFDDFNKNISSVYQDIETLKQEANADTESYDALQKNIMEIISKHNSVTLEQNNLLDEKENIQNQINGLSAPKPPSKFDYTVTNTLPDGLKETVVDEEKYAEAIEQYEKEMMEYNNKNTELTAKMDDVIRRLNINNNKLNSLEASKSDIIKDTNSVLKLQSMVNNSTNTHEESNLKESQKYLSKLIQKNAEDRSNKLKLESDFEKISISDYPLSEYNDKVSDYNEQMSQIQIDMECNDADIQYVFYNANLITLINELDTRGTGSKAMDKIIIDCTNEYNQLIEDKKQAISTAFGNPSYTKIPTPPVRNDYDTEEDYDDAMKIYEYKRSLYEKSCQESELRAQNSLSKIDEIDKNLALIEKMLFG